MVNSTTQSQDNQVVLSQAETDALLKLVESQIAQRTFNSNDQELLSRMVESLGDKRGMVRMGFAEALGAVGKPTVPLLLDALENHPNVVIRRAAAKTLTLIADPTAVPNLVESLLNDEDTVVKGSSVGALARTGETAVPPLLEILASPEQTESIKGHAAWALAFIGAKAKEQLYAAFDSKSPEVRSAVVGAIAKVAEEEPDDRAFNLLVSSLQDASVSVRSEAAAALGNLNYKPAISKLIELLQHEEEESRKAAALALMKVGDTHVLEPLKVALEQESTETVKPVINLAIAQLARQTEEEDW